MNGEIYETQAPSEEAAMDWGNMLLTHMLMDAVTHKESSERVKAIVDLGGAVNKDLQVAHIITG